MSGKKNLCPVEGKYRLRDEKHAKEVLASIARRPGDAASKPHRYYLCDHCSAWHLTSKVWVAPVSQAHRVRRLKNAPDVEWFVFDDDDD